MGKAYWRELRKKKQILIPDSRFFSNRNAHHKLDVRHCVLWDWWPNSNEIAKHRKIMDTYIQSSIHITCLLTIYIQVTTTWMVWPRPPAYTVPMIAVLLQTRLLEFIWVSILLVRVYMHMTQCMFWPGWQVIAMPTWRYWLGLMFWNCSGIV